jgi:nitroreductase
MLENIDWIGAIEARRSTRSYEMRPVETDKMDRLRAFADGLDLPFSQKVEARFFTANLDRKLYMVYSSPPDNMAFVADTDVLSISAAGFVGELAILYATSLGLATCWYGHYDLAELERTMPHLGVHARESNPRWGYGKEAVEGARAICVTPLGYWKQEGVRLFDRVQETLVIHKRKPLAELTEGALDALPEAVRDALNLARLAPSAANSQHWRFHVDSDGGAVTIAMPEGYRHVKWEHPDVDIGICASHFWLGLTIKQVAFQLSLTEEQGRAVWRFALGDAR